MRLERKVEVDCGVCDRATQALPFGGDNTPRVLHQHIIPTWLERCSETGERRGGEDRDDSEPVVMHDYKKSVVIKALMFRCREPQNLYAVTGSVNRSFRDKTLEKL